MVVVVVLALIYWRAQERQSEKQTDRLAALVYCCC